MNKGAKIAIVVALIVALIGGAFVVFGGSSTNKDDGGNAETSPASHEDNTHQDSEAHEDDNSPVAATITYTEDGFDPSSITVKSGDKIRITNQSGNPLELSSDPHPSHTINPELNAGDTEDGQSTTITVTKTGEWGVHNHYSASDRATVNVE